MILSTTPFRMYKNRYHLNNFVYHKCDSLYFSSTKKLAWLIDWEFYAVSAIFQQCNDEKAIINIFYLKSKTRCRHYGGVFCIYFLDDRINFRDGHLYFHHNADTVPALNDKFECKVHGRYLTFYNERLPNVQYPDLYSSSAVIQLCEVNILGEYLCSVPWGISICIC